MTVADSSPIDRSDDHGPFDVIGDVHGCLDELLSLLARLGYVDDRGRGVPSTQRCAPHSGASAIEPPAGAGAPRIHHPDGRTAVFVGDLVDRGPDTPGVLRLVMAMIGDGAALSVAGNHDDKLARALAGQSVSISRGRALSLVQLEREPELRRRAPAFLDGLPSHFVLDSGRLVVAHAGLAEELQGGTSARVRDFALYGARSGERDARGFPVRLDWAASYRGRALVVFGHLVVAEPLWKNNTVNIDTGCVFGGRLTALRYPEQELVCVPAARAYFDRNGPVPAPA